MRGVSAQATFLYNMLIQSEPDLHNIRVAVKAYIVEQGGGKACLEKGINEAGFTALCLAAAFNRGNVVRMLLQEGACPNTRSGPEGDTPLTVASLQGLEDIVHQLIDAGAKVNAASGDGKTPLYTACEKGRVALIGKLVAWGATIEQQDKKGMNVLLHAAFAGQLSVVNALLTAGARVDAVGGPENATALCFAAQQGHPKVAQALLSAGAEVDMVRSDGFSPLHIAAQLGHVSVIRVLISAGAEVDKKGGARTSLLGAAYYNHEGAIQELLKAGASVAEAVKMATTLRLRDAPNRLVAAEKRYFDSLGVTGVMEACDRICWQKEGRSQQHGGPLQRGLRPEALQEIATEGPF